MAQLVLDERYPHAISQMFSWWRVATIGAALGVLYVILTSMIKMWIVEPLFCGQNLNVSACMNATDSAGNIANLIVFGAGLFALIRLGVLRPLLIALASAITVWGLAGWMEGIGWVETLLWAILAYALSYVTYAWISRYTVTIWALLGVVAVVVVIRVLLAL